MYEKCTTSSSPYTWCMDLYNSDFCCMVLYNKHFPRTRELSSIPNQRTLITYMAYRVFVFSLLSVMEDGWWSFVFREHHFFISWFRSGRKKLQEAGIVDIVLVIQQWQWPPPKSIWLPNDLLWSFVLVRRTTDCVSILFGTGVMIEFGGNAL